MSEAVLFPTGDSPSPFGRVLELLDAWLVAECDWLGELLTSACPPDDADTRAEVAENQRVIAHNLTIYRRLLPHLLAAELDISGVGRRLEAFEILARAYTSRVRLLEAER